MSHSSPTISIDCVRLLVTTNKPNRSVQTAVPRVTTTFVYKWGHSKSFKTKSLQAAIQPLRSTLDVMNTPRHHLAQIIDSDHSLFYTLPYYVCWNLTLLVDFTEKRVKNRYLIEQIHLNPKSKTV